MKTKSLFVVMTCIMVAVAIITALLTPPATWNLHTLAAYGQTTSQSNTSEIISASENIQHWEKYDFIITSPELASKLGVSPNTELNIKIAGDASYVEDMRQAVLDFFNANATTTEADKSSIQILGTFSDVICTQ